MDNTDNLYLIFSVIKQLTEKYNIDNIDKYDIIEHIEPLLFNKAKYDSRKFIELNTNISFDIDIFIENGYLIFKNNCIKINNKSEEYIKYKRIYEIKEKYTKKTYLLYKNIYENNVESEMENEYFDLNFNDDKQDNNNECKYKFDERIENNQDNQQEKRFKVSIKKNISPVFKKIIDENNQNKNDNDIEIESVSNLFVSSSTNSDIETTEDIHFVNDDIDNISVKSFENIIDMKKNEIYIVIEDNENKEYYYVDNSLTFCSCKEFLNSNKEKICSHITKLSNDLNNNIKIKSPYLIVKPDETICTCDTFKKNNSCFHIMFMNTNK